MDEQLGLRLGGTLEGGQGSSAPRFRAAMRRDADKYISREFINDAGERHLTELYNTTWPELNTGVMKDDGSISNLLGAVTDDYLVGEMEHGAQYYQRFNHRRDIHPSDNWGRRTEAFADMTEVYGRADRTGWNYLEEHLPAMTEEYIHMVRLAGIPL